MGSFRSICYCEHTTDPVAAMGEKKKKKEEKKEPTPPPAPKVEEKKPKKKKVAKKKRSTGPKYSGSLTIFNEKQIREFKNGFNMMDSDSDGIISKQDLLMCYDKIGVRADDRELDEMVGEAPNPITFTQMLTLFADRMQGAVDDEDLIIDSFKAFDEGDGSIDPVLFENAMTGKGDALTKAEIKLIWPQLPMFGGDEHPNHFSMVGIVKMLTSKKEEEPPPPPPPPAEVAPAEEAPPEEISAFGDEEEDVWG